MKRPLAIIGFTYLITLAVAVHLSFNLTVTAAVLTLLCAVGLMCLKSFKGFRAVICALMTACVAFSVFSVYSIIKIVPLEKLYGSEAYITGTVADLPYENYGRYYYIVKTDSIDIGGAVQKTKIRVSSSSPLEADMSDRVQLAVRINSPDGQGYSSKEYNYSKGIYLYANVLNNYPVSITSSNRKSMYYYAVQVRKFLKEKIETAYPDKNGGLLAGILLGDTSNISDDVVNDFRRTGISHLLAVSGMHTALIGRWLMLLFEKLKAGKKLSSVLASLGVIFFMALTGFSASVTRAGIMTVICLLSNLFGRKNDSLNSLGASCLIMCLNNPYSACDIGFLLSVAATLGLIVLLPRFSVYYRKHTKNIKNNFVKKLCEGVCGVLTESLSASLFTLPLTVSFFGEFSLVSLPTNVLTVLPSTVFMAVGTVSLLFFDSGIISFLFYPFKIATVIIGEYLHRVVGLLSDIPYASVPMPFKFVSLWIAAVLILFGIGIIFSREKRLYKLCAVLSVILFIASTVSYNIFNVNVVKTGIIDVGDGCAVAIIKNKHGILLECGGGKLSYIDIEDVFYENGITNTDFILISQLNKGRSYSCDKMIDSLTPTAVIAPTDGERLDNLMIACNNKNIKMYNVDGATGSFWQKERFEVFSDTEENRFIFFESGEYSLLICPENGNADCLPDRAKNPAVTVISGKIPENVWRIKSGITILSASADNCGEMKDSLDGLGFSNILTTGESGNIILESRSDKSLTVRSEH